MELEREAFDAMSKFMKEGRRVEQLFIGAGLDLPPPLKRFLGKSEVRPRLTDRENQAFEFICNCCQDDLGIGAKEIAEHVGISISGAYGLIMRLGGKGYVTREKGTQKSIAPVMR